MTKFHVLFLLIILVMTGIFSISGVTLADHELYSTKFKDASSWETNSQASFYQDAINESYHYKIEGGTGSYSSVELPSPVSGPFSLEFDVMPLQTDEKSSFRFGIGNEEMDSMKGPLILAEFNNQNGDNLFSIVAISKENLVSKTYSMPGKENYSGKTVRFSDGTKYHVKLIWYPGDKRVSMSVTNPGDQALVFSHYIFVSGKMEELTRLFMTSIGEGQGGSRAEGYIDNITLTALDSVVDNSDTSALVTQTEVPVPTLVIESSGTEVIDDSYIEVQTQERTRFASPPTSTPTPTQKSGFSPIIGLLGIFGIILIYRKYK